MKTVILIAIIVVVAFFALRALVRTFKGEGCSCGDGGKCSSGGVCSCGGHHKSEEKEHKCNCGHHHE